MAVDAVASEPFSGRHSLLSRENTGYSSNRSGIALPKLPSMRFSVGTAQIEKFSTVRIELDGWIEILDGAVVLALAHVNPALYRVNSKKGPSA